MDFLKAFDCYTSEFILIPMSNIYKLFKVVEDGDVKYMVFCHDCDIYEKGYIINKKCESSYRYVSEMFDGGSSDFLAVSEIRTGEIILVSKKDIMNVTSSIDNDGLLIFHVHHLKAHAIEVRPTNKYSYDYIKSLFEF
jgi:hypothetical protein